MKYFNGMKKMDLTLSYDNTTFIKWYVNPLLVVHPDFVSHNGTTMKMGQGAMIKISNKNKIIQYHHRSIVSSCIWRHDDDNRETIIF